MQDAGRGYSWIETFKSCQNNKLAAFFNIRIPIYKRINCALLGGINIELQRETIHDLGQPAIQEQSMNCLFSRDLDACLAWPCSIVPLSSCRTCGIMKFDSGGWIQRRQH